MGIGNRDRAGVERTILRAFLWLVLAFSVLGFAVGMVPSERGKGEEPTVLIALATAAAGFLAISGERGHRP